jgi:hypothetical protein
VESRYLSWFFTTAISVPMKLWLSIAFLCASALSQTTPNYKFNVPSQNATNYGTLNNQNWTTLDSLLPTVVVSSANCSSVGLNAAIASLPSIGGIVDARGCQGGPFFLTNTVNVGSNTQNVNLLLGVGTWTQNSNVNPGWIVHVRSTLTTVQGTVINKCTVTGANCNVSTSNANNIMIVGGTSSPTLGLVGGVFGQGLITGNGAGDTGKCFIWGGTTDPGNNASNAANFDMMGPLTVQQCGTDEYYGNNVYGIQHDHSFIGRAISSVVTFPGAAVGSGENISYNNAFFFMNQGDGFGTITQTSSGTATWEFACNACSFDGVFFNVVNGSAASLFTRNTLTDPHFEALGSLGATTTDFINVTGSGTGGAYIAVLGGSFQEDVVSSGRTEFITINNAATHFMSSGTQFIALETVAAVVAAAAGSAELYGPTTAGFSQTFSGASANVIACTAITPGVGTPQCRMGAAAGTSLVPVGQAAGTTALPTGALTANTCAAATSAAASGATTAMHIDWHLASTPVGVTGYGTGQIQIYAWLTSGNVNFLQCSSASLTPGSMSVQWEVLNP